MNFIERNAVALIALVVAIIGCYLPVSSAVQSSFGGVTTYDEVDATAIKIGGTNGSRVGPIITGTGSLIMPSFSITASTSQVADIAVTGVVTGDIVFAQFATSSPQTGGGWNITQASASTTAGFVTVNFTNTTGTTNIIPASVASTTKVLIFHPLTAVPGL